jgi:hypothetical protein
MQGRTYQDPPGCTCRPGETISAGGRRANVLKPDAAFSPWLSDQQKRRAARTGRDKGLTCCNCGSSEPVPEDEARDASGRWCRHRAEILRATSVHTGKRSARVNSGGHVEATMCSALWHLLSYDPLEEHTVRYVMQRAICGAKGDRSVAEVFDDACNSVH